MEIREEIEKFKEKIYDLIADFKLEAFIPLECSECDKKEYCKPMKRDLESANAFLRIILYACLDYLQNILPPETIIYNIKGVVDDWAYCHIKKFRGRLYGDSD